MLPVATFAKTTTQALTGSLVALTIPAGRDWKEVHLTAAAGFSFAFSASDPQFPVAAGVIYPMPLQPGQGTTIFVTGAGNLLAAFYGY